jgi:hypothetical protein
MAFNINVNFNDKRITPNINIDKVKDKDKLTHLIIKFIS